MEARESKTETARETPAVPSSVPSAVPFVSTKLSAVWIATDTSIKSVWLTGWTRSQQTDNYRAKTQVHYRLTPPVYAWLNRQIERAVDRAEAGDVAIASAMPTMLDQWEALKVWAAGEYGAEALNGAKAQLPDIECALSETQHVWDHPACRTVRERLATVA